MQPKDPVKADSTQAKSLPTRIYSWFNKRTGLGNIMQASLDEPIPGGARLAYVFGSGLLFIFISQVITGIALALYYVPSAETAHTSVAYITKQVAAGRVPAQPALLRLERDDHCARSALPADFSLGVV